MDWLGSAYIEIQDSNRQGRIETRYCLLSDELPGVPFVSFPNRLISLWPQPLKDREEG